MRRYIAKKSALSTGNLTLWFLLTFKRHKKLIGKIESALYFPTETVAEPRLMVSNFDKTIVARLNPFNGSEERRYTMQGGDKLEWFGGEHYTLLSSTVNSSLTRLEYVNDEDKVEWVTVLPSAVCARKAFVFKDDVYVLGESICKVQKSDGQLLWCSKESLRGGFILSVDEERLYAVVAKNEDESEKAFLRMIKRKDGQLIKDFPLDAAISKASLFERSYNNAIWVSGDFLYGLVLNDAVSTPKVGKLKIDKGKTVLSLGLTNRAFSVKYHDAVVVGDLEDSGDFKIEKVLKGDIPVISRIDKCVASVKDGQLKISVGSYETTVPLKHGNIDLSLTEKIFLHRSSAEDVMWLATLKDSSLLMFKNDKLLWSREEALHDVVDVIRTELPVSSQLGNHFVRDAESNFVENFQRRWQYHLNSAMKRFSNTELDNELKVINQTGLERDRFGFRQLLIVATRANKIFAIKTENGDIAWSLYLPESSSLQLFLTKSVHSGHLPQISIVSKNEGKSSILVVDALVGEVKEKLQSPINEPHTSAFMLPSKLPDGEQALGLFYRKTLEVAVFPSNAVTEAVLDEETLTKLFFTDMDEQNGVIKGYSVARSGNSLKAVERWKLEFGKEEKIVCTSSKSEFDVSSSIGRVLGDRSVLYKYLNPNLIAVATSYQKKEMLNLYLVDLASGRIVQHVKHDNFHPGLPVHISQSENWVSYYFWSKQSFSRTENKFELIPQVNIIELYESTIPDVRFESTNFTSFSSNLPDVLRQSYLLHAGVSSMAVTQTTSGITRREILFGTDDGRIVSFSKSLIDPRRPFKLPNALTADEKEEMLVPYKAVLEENPKEVLTHMYQVSLLFRISF
jgi:hypothetical protein